MSGHFRVWYGCLVKGGNSGLLQKQCKRWYWGIKGQGVKCFKVHSIRTPNCSFLGPGWTPPDDGPSRSININFLFVLLPLFFSLFLILGRWLIVLVSETFFLYNAPLNSFSIIIPFSQTGFNQFHYSFQINFKIQFFFFGILWFFFMSKCSQLLCVSRVCFLFIIYF